MMRRAIVLVALCLVSTCTIVSLSGANERAIATDASAPAGAGPFTKTETITRDNVVNGSNVVVDSRTVTLKVSETQNLQGRQEIGVSWSGAHPTGGIVADQNSDQAQHEEYPFVLLECRGTDSAASPLQPDTCWTQAWDERYQDSLGDAYPPYRLDEDASAAQTAPIVGAPSTLPAACQYDESAPVQHWVPFIAASGQVYAGGNAGCAGQAPESNNVGGAGIPSNETFGITGTDGTGSTSFDVWTKAENASLGCSETVACSLVAVPIMGINCNPSSTTPAVDVSQCEETGAFTPGQLMPSAGGGDLTVSGSLWWAQSNWQNRIAVPLTFAVPADACSVVSSNQVIDVYGSELMIQATGQWEPNFCLSDADKFSFVHVQTGEPEARNLVATGGAEAAFTSYAQPGGYGKPVVNAPVAVTGFAISYAIDGANGQPYTTLKLTPLLLAKLLTESYPGTLFMKQDDSALTNNPINITMDPEFIALNPGIAQNNSAGDVAAAELIALSGNSDVIHALTTYINDDPTARAWLNGAPDHWGMVVNPAYKGIQLPVDRWPLLSTFVPTSYYNTDVNDCLFNDPVPYQPLIAAPLSALEGISESIQYDLPNSTTVCSQPVADSAAGEKLVTNGRQTVGFRFMIGITPLADNQRYDLQAAALQTTSGTFVAPDNTTLQAATSLLQPDVASGSWPIPYDAFETSAGAAAYPGTMIVYAAVPTTGLPTSDAQDYSTLLKFAATSGQTPGLGVGQLPPGYLPMTAANGLGALAAYTEAAAADVAAQNGQVPSLTNPTQNSSTYPYSSSGYSGYGYGSGLYPTSSTSASGSSSQKTSQSVAGLPASSVSPLRIGLWTADLPLLLIFGPALLCLLAVPALYRSGRRRGRW